MTPSLMIADFEECWENLGILNQTTYTYVLMVKKKECYTQDIVTHKLHAFNILDVLLQFINIMTVMMVI